MESSADVRAVITKGKFFVEIETLPTILFPDYHHPKIRTMALMLPNQSIFVNTIALREAKASSAIENIFTTDDARVLWRATAY